MVRYARFRSSPCPVADLLLGTCSQMCAALCCVQWQPLKRRWIPGSIQTPLSRCCALCQLQRADSFNSLSTLLTHGCTVLGNEALIHFSCVWVPCRLQWAEYFKSQNIDFIFWSAMDASSDAPLVHPEDSHSHAGTGAGRGSEDPTHVYTRDELLALLEKKAQEVRDAGLDVPGRVGLRGAHPGQPGQPGQARQGGAGEGEGGEARTGQVEGAPGGDREGQRGEGEEGSEGEEGTSGAGGGGQGQGHGVGNVGDEERPVMVGFVGYPNVGKSSTINALVGFKKTGVTSTPGKTKHFQTLPITPGLTLCDCPGLVFPSFASRYVDMASGLFLADWHVLSTLSLEPGSSDTVSYPRPFPWIVA